MIAVNRGTLAGRCILVLEDEPLIALEIVACLREAGASVFSARCLRDALPLADHPDLTAAVLDFGLRDGDAGAVCERLSTRDIPFVLYSGYVHTHAACRKGTHLRKPASRDELLAALSHLIH